MQQYLGCCEFNYLTRTKEDMWLKIKAQVSKMLISDILDYGSPSLFRGKYKHIKCHWTWKWIIVNLAFQKIVKLTKGSIIYLFIFWTESFGDIGKLNFGFK